MRKELVFLGLVIVFNAPVNLTSRAAPPGQALNPQPAGTRAPLTNADVIKMVQEIMTSIRSGPVKFDLSPAAIAEMRRAGVSALMLAAMEQQQKQSAAAGASPTPPAPAGNKPGQPARKLTPQDVKAMLAKVHSGKGKLSPIVTNPAAGQANGAILAALQQQKQMALVERSQATPPAGRPQSPAEARATVARTPFPVAAPPPSNSGSSLANRAALGGQLNINVACATFNSPIIQAVSGQSGSTAVFTQDPAYNPFTIKGCNFGIVKGQAQLNFMNGKKLSDLAIDTWTDNLITVEVPPSLTDALDQNSITLVLFPANGPQASRSGFRFYAMRREILLAAIPASQVFLRPISDTSGAPVRPEYSSPYRGLANTFSQQSGASIADCPNDDAGMSAGVDRNDLYRFSGGTDVFDFGKLKPGFILERFQIDERNVAICHGGWTVGLGAETAYNDGSWDARILQNTIGVTWAETHCHISNGSDSSNSSYALNVWVVGPALSPGTSPWQDGVH